MDEAVIRVQGLGKRYRIGLRAHANRTFGEMLAAGLRRPFRGRGAAAGGGQLDHIWALRDISFEVARGEVIGIIGANGAGKSTLLKILSRITEPTAGRAELRGSVGSLLEVGTGFHPELTGRENIYLNGAILGLKRAEIAARFDEIVAFAELERFLDTPVKRYSSGMYVRLAFAVAAHLQPEVLIVDEVLAVGDVAFQKKCLGAMGRVAREGRTVLLVSHNLAAIAQICPRAILLNSGRMAFDGAAHEAVRRYLGESAPDAARVSFPVDPAKAAQLTGLGVETVDGRDTAVIEHGDAFAVSVCYSAQQWRPGTYVCLAVTNEAGVRVLWSSDAQDAISLEMQRAAGSYEARVTVPAAILPPGRYYVSAAIYAPPAERAFDFRERAIAFEVQDHQSILKRFGIEFPAVTAIKLHWSTQYVGCCPGQDRPAAVVQGMHVAAAV